MKSKYSVVEVEILFCNAQDVITTSGGVQDSGDTIYSWEYLFGGNKS